MNQKNQIVLKKIVIIAMLTALCCAATFVQIKMPTGDMVHLGNFVMIISALLLGGIEGGIVGSFGMGLYDLIFYTTKPSTILRTFILKFLIGFIVGYVFRLILKRKIKTTHLLVGATVLFLALFGISLGLFIVGDKAEFAFKTGLLAKVDNFFGSGKAVNVSLYIPIFSFIFAFGMGLSIIFERKLSTRSRAALFAITLAILVNIVGEFILRWVLEGLMVSDFNTSIIVATSKIPGSLITGFISVFLAALIYEPVYMGVKNLDVFKDNTSSYVEDEEDIEIEEIDNQLSSSNSENKLA